MATKFIGYEFKLMTDSLAFKQTLNKRDLPKEVAQWIIHLKRLKNAQKHDDNLKTIFKILKNQSYNKFKVKNDILYKCLVGTDLLVVLRAMDNEIIINAHEVGHFSTQKTTHAVQQYYWITHLEAKVNQLIKNCVSCIIHNRKLGI